MIKKKKRAGFTLVEMVIVLAIIGVLAMMLMPQYQEVAGTARLYAFQRNCHVLGYAAAIYQSEHEGSMPSVPEDLDPYITGGWSKIENNPRGAVYTLYGDEIRASFTEDDGTAHYFTYPD